MMISKKDKLAIAEAVAATYRPGAPTYSDDDLQLAWALFDIFVHDCAGSASDVLKKHQQEILTQCKVEPDLPTIWKN